VADGRLSLEQRRALALAKAKLAAQGAAKPAPPMFTPSGEKDTPSWTDPDVIAGNPVTRFAMGAASPFIGLGQLAANVTGVGDETINKHLGEVEDMKQSGRKKLGSEGFDVTETAGAVLSPVGLKVAKALPVAPTAMGRVGQGVALGTAAGASTPVTEGDSYWGSKGVQTVTGALLGGAIPGAIEVGKGVAGAVRDVANLFTNKGAGRILTRYQGRIVGDKGRQDVIDALKASREPVPGYQPTAAEAVANVPAGSPIIAHQKITAGTPGGPSAEFGQRVIDQKAALEAAAQARNAATGPMRETAVKAANMSGVETGAITKGIDATLGKPGIRASDVVQKTLNSVKEKIAAFDNHGLIDANDLYTIRKEIGNTIKTHAKETANWDKKLTAGLERDVQKAIDDAIEAAGGAGWKQYLNEYAQRSTGIEAAKAGVKAAAKPAQRTNLGGGGNVAEESRVHLPQMLSRPMMIANAVMKRLGSGVEPRLDAEATRRYLNPQVLAKELEKLPPQQQSVVSALLQRMGIIGSATTIADQEQF
jgi:hypothetical protein